MSDPFLAEIRIMGFDFAPQGWALCNGQFLPINQNQALFALLGTTYGGNGQTTFQLPDLRRRVPIHFDNAHSLGTRAGEDAHTISIAELPTHTHFVSGSTATATLDSPAGNVFATTISTNIYTGPSGLVAMNAGMVANQGGSQPHENRQPFLVLSFCIALQGLFPSQN